MKTTAVFSMLLVILVVICPGADPALAFFPPFQDVTGPTVTQGTDTKVTVSVYNPATGQNIPYTWTIAGGADDITIDQIATSQGMVAWRVKDKINNKFKIVWGVYDPGWAALMGQPQSGWQITETWIWIDYNTNIIALNDGVLLYETKYKTTGDQTNIVDHFWAYDPDAWYEEFQHGWMLYGWREFTYSFSNYSDGTTRDHIVKDGVAGLIYDNNSSWSRTIEVIYAVYDGRNHGWINDQTSATIPDAPQITNATVYWSDGDVLHKSGYDYTDRTWKAEQNTRVMACFAVWPKPAKVSQWVYFTDMSLAAGAWNWNLGDNTTRTVRSLYHQYRSAGHYAAVQEVAVGESYQQNVIVKSTLFPGNLLLLLQAP
jgi:hypothetical protein